MILWQSNQASAKRNDTANTNRESRPSNDKMEPRHDNCTASKVATWNSNFGQIHDFEEVLFCNFFLKSHSFRIVTNAGSGGNTRLAELASEEHHKQLEDAVEGADLVFIAAGLGGGVGTGIAPIVGKYVRTLPERQMET